MAKGGSRVSGDNRLDAKSEADGEFSDWEVGDLLSKVRRGLSLFFIMLSQ